MPRLSAPEKAAFAALDHWLDFRTRFAGLPGLQASIRRKGELVFSKAYGFANEPRGEKYTPRHVGHIASHSKLFTSCLALQLMAAGTWSINDAAATHLPWLKQHKDKRFREITLRDLMSNRSGIFRDGLDAAFWEMERPFLSHTQLRDEIMASRLVYAPNTETKYSNIGVSLLGLALEAASGKSYDRLAHGLILDKLKGTLLMTDYGLRKGVTYADGHSKKFYNGRRKIFRHAKAEAMASATGYCGNTESTTQFLNELYKGGRLLPPALQRELLHLHWMVKNLPSEFYGLGSMFGTAGNNVYIGHAGGFPGFTSQTRMKEDSDWIFSAILNANEIFSFNVIRSMADLLKKIETVFGTEKNLEVTSPLMNRWSSSVYIIGRKKALALPLESWSPMDESFELERRRDGAFYTDKLGGYLSVGEPAVFIRKQGRIVAMKFGAHTTHETGRYLKRPTKAFA